MAGDDGVASSDADADIDAVPIERPERERSRAKRRTGRTPTPPRGDVREGSEQVDGGFDNSQMSADAALDAMLAEEAAAVAASAVGQTAQQSSAPQLSIRGGSHEREGPYGRSADRSRRASHRARLEYEMRAQALPLSAFDG